MYKEGIIQGREKPKSDFEKMTELMEKISYEINERAFLESRMAGLVDRSCRISMGGFDSEVGGIYSGEKIESDEEKIRRQEIVNSAAESENVQAFYLEKFGANTKEKIVQKWKQNMEKSLPNQLEMVLTAVFHKILKEDFIAVRTSVFDDYFGRVDNFIIDTKTGDVICAFDEVHDEPGRDRYEKKEKKIQSFARKGGTTIEYGILSEDGLLKRARVENVPVFFLGLSQDELKKVQANMDYNPSGKVSSFEMEIFEKLIASLEQQKEILLANYQNRNKFLNFEKMIGKMKGCVLALKNKEQPE